MKDQFKKIQTKYHLIISVSIMVYSLLTYLISQQFNYSDFKLRNQENEGVYEVFAALILICGVIYSFVNYRSTFIGVNDEPIKDLLKNYTKAIFVRITTLTVLGMYTLAVCFATENTLFVLPLVVIVIMQAKSYPSFKKFVAIYQLNENEIITLENSITN